MTWLQYVPVGVFVTLVGSLLAVWPKLKELSSQRMEDAINAWKAVAEHTEERMKAVEEKCAKLQTALEECQDQCRAAEIRHDDEIRAMNAKFAQFQQSTANLLGDRE